MDGFKVTNPSLEQFLSIGWSEYTPEPEPALPTIEELVESKIREKYTINQEFEVQRKRDIEPDAFQTYYNYVEECIAWAHEQNNIYACSMWLSGLKVYPYEMTADEVLNEYNNSID